MLATAEKASGSVLAERSNQRIREFFNGNTQHRPSEQMYQALEDITGTLSAMAEGRADAVVFLSSLDPGIGKTTAVSSFVESLIEDEGYSHVGVMICVARLDEIRGMVERMNIPGERFAVLTSDKDVNALSSTKVDDSQVLFTTQQRLENHLDGDSFAAAEEFYYKGKPRDVRIWDETWLPGVGVVVGKDDLSSLLKPMRPVYPELTKVVDGLIDRIRDLDEGSRLEIPDFESDYGVDLNAALRAVDGSQSANSSVTSLWLMSGKTVTIRRDGAYGSVMLTYHQTLPEDLAPMIVLDASGRVRETYAEMESCRGNIVRLTSARKRYDDLTIHHWNVGGGKTAWSDSGRFRELADGIASTIKKKPEDKWLIVVHKTGGKIRNVESAVRDLLGLDHDHSKVHFINWGRHMATNAYADIPNVILAGTLFLRPSTYEALGRLAADRSPDHEYSDKDMRRIAMGEHMHCILQALCRASVRQCRGDSCPPCDAYVIASITSGIPATLPKVFPGAKIREWRPVKRELKGKIKAVLAYLDQRIDEGCKCIKFKEVTKVVGIRDSSNFRSDIRQHPDFKAELAERCIREAGKCYMTEFRIMDASYFGFVDESCV